MNIISGQIGIIEEREDETQTEREGERLHLISFLIESDDAPQTVVSNCCRSCVYFFTVCILV